jgi:hypothetical protein
LLPSTTVYTFRTFHTFYTFHTFHTFQPSNLSTSCIVTQDKEIQKQRDAMTLLKSRRSDVESRACASEVEAEHALAQLETNVKRYNDVARQLQLIPHTAKYATNASTFEAAINPRAHTEQTMVRTRMRPHLNHNP